MVKFYTNTTKEETKIKAYDSIIEIDDSLYTQTEKRLLRDIAKLLGCEEL